MAFSCLVAFSSKDYELQEAYCFKVWLTFNTWDETVPVKVCLEGGSEAVGSFDRMLFSSVCLFYSKYLLIRRGKGIVKLPLGSCRGDLFSLLKTDMAKENGQLPAGWELDWKEPGGTCLCPLLSLVFWVKFIEQIPQISSKIPLELYLFDTNFFKLSSKFYFY